MLNAYMYQHPVKKSEAKAVQSEKRIFDDLSKVITGIAGTVAGMGREAEAGIKDRAREWVSGLDGVSREEFDAVKTMAATARAEADALKARVAALEAALGVKAAAKPAATTAKTPPKAAPKAKPAAKPRSAK
jgi:BMFP domain-containing protein YqiC